jgi:hypothetical protein
MILFLLMSVRIEEGPPSLSPKIQGGPPTLCSPKKLLNSPCTPLSRPMDRGCQARPHLTKSWGLLIYRRKGGGTIFRSFENENIEKRSVKRSILTTLVATKAQKRLKIA